MITIKSLGKPEPGTSWSYGPRHMCKISKADARKLCGAYPMPKPGYETTVAVLPHQRQRESWEKLFGDTLQVQNLGGDFYLACTTFDIEDWPAKFKVRIQEQQ